MYQGRLRSHTKKRKLDLEDLNRKRDTIRAWIRKRAPTWPKNKVDPITLEPLVPPVFKHVNNEGYVTGFDANTLADYFRATGNFVHPNTRTPFNRVEIKRLDKLIKGAPRSLLDEQEELQARRGRSLEQMAEVRRLEATLQLTFENIVASARLRNVPRAALHQIIMIHFPTYHGIMMQLLALNQPLEVLGNIVFSQTQTLLEATPFSHLELIALIMAELEAVLHTLEESRGHSATV